ncbi:DUF3566 domain-containing protein [Williamsia sp. CHRR-6]|uniref:DUF3566 domain-containing protein n=1 Tax=Williamsia sp. CHRR-6 TaxID=2835871 RepID=UPI001BDAC0DD|nr:DUF3566 domain-containing protein [Williamsia sp. CHRR-6]MBT0567732.1 DUF3566 domain-containing protein [Williamsia sp. CHRR-6]
MSTPQESQASAVADRAAQNGAGQNGASPHGADEPSADAAEVTESTDTTTESAASEAGGAGGKPPWQRVGATLPNTGSPAPGVEPNNPAAEPTRPLVTGTKAPGAPTPSIPSATAPTTKVPIAKVDSEGRLGARPPAATANGRNSLVGKVIDGPTRNIDRSDIPDDLPDLDAIHHPGAYAPAAPGPTPAAPDQAPLPGYAPQAAPAAVQSAPTRAVEAVAAGGARGPLRASVQLRRIDPWSTFKISAVLAIALFLIWMIATGVLYVVLDGMGVWDSVNSSFRTVTSSDTTTTNSFEVTAGGVFGISALIGAVYVIVFTALTTVGAFIYNMSADLVGGVEVTLADRD